jgi:uncharacterized membrane protein
MKFKIFKRENLEKNSMKLIGIFLGIMFVMYGLASLGLSTWLVWIPMIFGFFMSLFLFIEGGFVSWLKSKSWKSFDVSDIIIILSFLTSVALAMNSVLLLNIIRESAPGWLVSFSSVTGVIVSGIGLILSLLHFFSKKFK